MDILLNGLLCSQQARSVALCLLLLLPTTQLSASPDEPLLTREQTSNQVRRQHGGKVLKIDPIETHAGPAYRVKLLQPSGRVKLLMIDARSGRAIPFKKKR